MTAFEPYTSGIRSNLSTNISHNHCPEFNKRYINFKWYLMWPVVDVIKLFLEEI